MKKIHRHNEFNIDHSLGIGGGQTPTYKEMKEEYAISWEEVNELVNYFLDESKLDFQYIYNGCKNRAMVMSLLLKEKNIQHAKIWNFDPSKIALYSRPNALNLEDPLGLKKEVYWDFHVAIAILVKDKDKGKAGKYVIDPSFTHLPIAVADWLSKPNSANSYYTYLDPEWFEFVTLQSGSSIVCEDNTSKISIPDCFPEIITGDFYKYGSENIPEIADELAADKQVTNITYNVIRQWDGADAEKDELINFLTEYQNIDAILRGDKEINSSHVFYPYVPEYRRAYSELYEYWLKKLNSLQ